MSPRDPGGSHTPGFEMRFELHCHSTESDGTESPAQVLARAQPRGIDVFALTDHDTCTTALLPGARSLRGVEISCDEPATGRTIHVLAYDPAAPRWSEPDLPLPTLPQPRPKRL